MIHKDYRKYLIFFIFLVFNSTQAQNYLWPTNSSNYMSSSFCEFREGHYHSGIDIKTWMREGYECYAIEDGYIERILVSPFGYGKVIYLRLKDGNLAVYAHLQCFTKNVDKQIRQMQMENQKYRLNWWPKKLKVKKGDVIAYTGRTGIGVPHFHFEIRNWKNRPVNPLQFYSVIKDRLRPRLQNLALIPVSQNSTINGNFLPQVFSLTYIKDGLYIIKDPLYIKGIVGFAVKGFDQANGAGNKYGFYQTTMEVDGQEAFQITYDEINFSSTSHIFTEIYYPFWADYGVVFHKLYIDPYNPLRFYKKIQSSNGFITMENKPKTFTITVQDFHGNKSYIRGELQSDNHKPLSLNLVKKNGAWANVHLITESSADMKLFTGKDESCPVEVKDYEILDSKIDNSDLHLYLKVNLKDSTNNFLNVFLNSKNNQTLQKQIILNDNYIDSLNVNVDLYFFGAKIIVECNNFFDNCSLKIEPAGQTIELNHIEKGKHQAVIPASLINSKKTKLQLFSTEGLLWSDSLEIESLLPGEENNSQWINSEFEIKTSKGSVPDTTLISVNAEVADSTLKDVPIISKIYDIIPGNFNIYKKISIGIKVDSIPKWGNWSIYELDDKNDLSFRTTNLDSNSLTFSARTSATGRFLVAADTIPPIVKVESPVSGGVYYKNPSVIIQSKDDFSGIGSDENISILIDGRYVLPEWDPEDDIVTAQFGELLSAARHTLEISVKDRAGNINKQIIHFTVQ